MRAPNAKPIAIVPRDYKKPMGEVLLLHLAAVIDATRQAIDGQPDPVVSFSERPTPAITDAKFAARAAVKWADKSERRDAILRLRQAISLVLGGKEFKRLVRVAAKEDCCEECGRKPLDQVTAFHLANEAWSAVRLHFEGISSPLHPQEREEMLVPEDSTFMSGGDAA